MDIFQALLIANSGQSGTGAFKFTINTEIRTVGNKDFYLPFYNATYVNPIEVDWGDGNVETLTGGTYPKHTYAIAGVYQISIKAVGGNEMPAWRCFNVWSSTYVYSSEQIISLDTPMLNFESTMDSNNGLWLFYHCRGLQTICSKLLINNSNLTNLQGAFSARYNESSLQSIPSDLFSYTPLITTLNQCFYYQSQITSIPSGLFDNLSELIAVPSCFENCLNLETIPDYLLRYNLKLHIFNRAFYNCTKISFGANLFCDEATEQATRFASVPNQPNFVSMFNRSTWDGSIQSTAPQLWNYTYAIAPSSTLAFNGSGNNTSSISNYDDIPIAWK